MKNICVAKEPILLGFNTLAICLFKYVFISYLKENGNRKISHKKKKKKKVMHSSTVRKMEKGVEEEQAALVTPWQPLALLCGSPYALRVGAKV